MAKREFLNNCFLPKGILFGILSVNDKYTKPLMGLTEEQSKELFRVIFFLKETYRT